MSNYQMKPVSIPLHDEFDVIVVGGGPAGCAAAVSAAREGAKTLLVEASGSLGGMGTIGLVPAWCPFSDKEKIIYRGLAERIFNRSKEFVPSQSKEALDWVSIDPEGLKQIYDELIQEYGVTVLFNTMLSQVDASEDGIVNAIILSSKAGLTAYKARVYVDCTGDADLAVWAGADYRIGEDGEPMPSSLCFSLANVDMYAYLYHPEMGVVNGGIYWERPNSPVKYIYRDSAYPDIKDEHLCEQLIGPGVIGFNAGHIWNVDNTNPDSLANAMYTGRRIARQYRDGLAKYFPEAFGNAYLVNTAQVIGIRESRRIIGDYVLSVEDYLSRASFPDEICRNSYYLDIHYTQEELKLKEEGKLDTEKRFSHYGPGESHGIPYRSLLPKGIQNVIVAGRSISCDKRIQGSVRVMPVCLTMGEAAGMAAAFAVQLPGHDVHKVDTDKLRARLKEEGAYLP